MHPLSPALQSVPSARFATSVSTCSQPTSPSRQVREPSVRTSAFGSFRGGYTSPWCSNATDTPPAPAAKDEVRLVTCAVARGCSALSSRVTSQLQPCAVCTSTEPAAQPPDAGQRLVCTYFSSTKVGMNRERDLLPSLR